ncbi:hypothetical protein PGQ11_014316 [Apiospora arundinis]|uniref:Uncharacterized protein n=1 Tax=Apiospora arundinis TaxID=335852 RepID=A0ABR2HS25_9PEZI
MPSLSLTKQDAADQEISTDVHYELSEKVGALKKRVLHENGYNSNAVFVFLVTSELSRIPEARDFPDEDCIGNHLPDGGSAKLSMGGADNKPETGNWAIEENTVKDTAQQDSVVAIEDIGTATGSGAIKKNSAAGNSSQLNFITTEVKDIAKSLLQGRKPRNV